MTTPTIAEPFLVDAATSVAEVFGLGDSAAVSTSWPVDDGDSVLNAEFAGADGAAVGRIYLAVNNEVARRLTSDPARLQGGLAKALAVFANALGGELQLVGEVATTAGEDVPQHRVEISDGAKLCALLGCTLYGPDAADGDEPDEPGAATAFTPAEFTDAHEEVNPMLAVLGPLSLLQDVDMEVTVELGRTTMPIRDLLALQPGMVVEIDRVAGTPIDVLVNGRRFACGEVVVIDEEFGLRITEIVGAS